MKPNDSNNALERERHEAELPELAVRILSDFARIVAADEIVVRDERRL